MGNSTNRRQLFDLAQAKAYMRTMLVASGCKKLLTQGKTIEHPGHVLHAQAQDRERPTKTRSTIRASSDTIIEDIEVLLGQHPRGAAPVCRKTRRHCGQHRRRPIRRDEIDCSRMGSGGYGIPSIVEPEVIQFDPKKCDAKFVLHVEKGTVWQRFNEDRFWKTHNCVLTHGAGQPPRGVRRMLHRLHNELKLPIYCVLDNDPWGYYIYSVLKQGSINLAFESQRMAIPEVRVPRAAQQRFRAVPAFGLSEDRAQRQGPQTGQANRQLSLVRQKARLAARESENAAERFQVGSRVVDLEGHQLRDGGVRAGAARRSGLVGLRKVEGRGSRVEGQKRIGSRRAFLARSACEIGGGRSLERLRAYKNLVKNPCGTLIDGSASGLGTVVAVPLPLRLAGRHNMRQALAISFLLEIVGLHRNAVRRVEPADSTGGGRPLGCSTRRQVCSRPARRKNLLMRRKIHGTFDRVVTLSRMVHRDRGHGHGAARDPSAEEPRLKMQTKRMRRRRQPLQQLLLQRHHRRLLRRHRLRHLR